MLDTSQIRHKLHVAQERGCASSDLAHSKCNGTIRKILRFSEIRAWRLMRCYTKKRGNRIAIDYKQMPCCEKK